MGKNETYEEFIDKFRTKPTKMTQDECYTPPNIYDVVADWVAERYGLDRSTFVRPFWPGGDYQSEDYAGKIVVDNPPFSILKKIQKWYSENGVKYFLFAHGTTCFSDYGTAVCTLLHLTYENGAKVSTSFVTNLEDECVVGMSCPELYRRVYKENKLNEANWRKKVTKHEYPTELITAANLGYMSHHGVDYAFRRSDGVFVRKLDNCKKGVFVAGWLLKPSAAADKATADKAAADNAEDEKIELSAREVEMLRQLD